jgi:hypothetical protein
MSGPLRPSCLSAAPHASAPSTSSAPRRSRNGCSRHSGNGSPPHPAARSARHPRAARHPARPPPSRCRRRHRWAARSVVCSGYSAACSRSWRWPPARAADARRCRCRVGSSTRLLGGPRCVGARSRESGLRGRMRAVARGVRAPRTGGACIGAGERDQPGDRGRGGADAGGTGTRTVIRPSPYTGWWVDTFLRAVWTPF